MPGIIRTYSNQSNNTHFSQAPTVVLANEEFQEPTPFPSLPQLTFPVSPKDKQQPARTYQIIQSTIRPGVTYASVVKTTLATQVTLQDFLKLFACYFPNVENLR